jgi:hypothetical protein
VYGDRHPVTLTTKDNLALMYWDQGRIEVILLLEMVLEPRRIVSGEQAPETLIVMETLADMKGSLLERSRTFDEDSGEFDNQNEQNDEEHVLRKRNWLPPNRHQFDTRLAPGLLNSSITRS